MKTAYVATHTVTNATRLQVLRMQEELTSLQKEVVSGRSADIGLSLGARTGQVVSLRQEHAGLRSMIDANALVSSRLQATQSAVANMSEDAQAFLAVLVDARGNPISAALAPEHAAVKLDAFVGRLNSTHRGEYLFAGINSDVKPVAAYTTEPPSAAKLAFDNAFVARFGFAADDPAAAGIGGADMRDFLANEFAALFDDASWSASWSSASDQEIRSRISSSELVTSGATANAEPVRQLAMAYAMVAELGGSSLSSDALGAVMDAAVSHVGEALQGLRETQARLGSTEEAVANASERMSIQLNVLATHIGTLENVDPYEASTRIGRLLTQIETSYALTARLQQLSLLNYL